MAAQLTAGVIAKMGGRSKIGVAGGGEGEHGETALVHPQSEASDAEPVSAPPNATFETEEPKKKVEGGGAVASAMSTAIKGQAVTSGVDLDRIMRQGFVRKVYGILAIQIIVTFGLIGGFQTKTVNNAMKQCMLIKCAHLTPDNNKESVDCLQPGCLEPGGQCLNPNANSLIADQTKPALNFQDDPSQCPGRMVAGGSGIAGDEAGNFYVQEPSGTMTFLYYAGLVASFSALIMLVCCIESLGRRYPHNYALLSVFTLGQGFNLATYCTMMDAEVILVAAGMTAVITLALSVFACQTKIDFTGSGAYLYAALWCLILFGFVINFGWAPAGAAKIYLLIGVLIFSMYLVYDTQVIVGGEHKTYQISMDDYVLAALIIYLDIINLFILLLQLLNGGRRD